MVESVIDVYPNQTSRINNLSSGVFNTSMGLGEVVGPLFGSAMYEKSGFRTTSDMTALVTIFYVFTFMCVLNNGVANTIKDTIRKTARLSDEEEKEEDDSAIDSKKAKMYKISKNKLKGGIEEDHFSMGSESLISHNTTEFGSKNKYDS